MNRSYHQTPQGEKAKVSAVGLEGQQPIALAVSIFLGFVIALTLRQVTSLPWAIGGGSSAPTLTLLYIIVLKRDKPARYDSEAREYLWFRIHQWFSDHFDKSPPKLFGRTNQEVQPPRAWHSALEHCYTVDDHLVRIYPGNVIIRVSRGFTLKTGTNLESASIRERESMERLLTTLIRTLSPEASYQMNWMSDKNAYLDAILAYKKTTDNASGNKWACTQRNHTFVNHLKDHEERKLRHATLAFFITFEVKTSGPHTPDAVAKAVASLAPAFTPTQQQLIMLAHTLGGSIDRLNDRELIKLNHRYFNGQPNGLSPEPDPLLSLRQNCIGGEAAPLSPAHHGFYLCGLHWSCIVLERPPNATTMGMIHHLTHLGIDVDISAVFTVKEPNTIIAKLEADCRKLENNAAANKRQELLTAIEGKREQIRRLTSEGAVPCTLQLIIVIKAKTLEEMRQHAELARSAIIRMQGAAPYEAAFPTSARNYALAAAPGNFSPYKDLTINMEDVHVSNFLPIDPVDTGDLEEAQIIVNGFSGNPVGIKIQGHGLGLGMTGSGKSMFVTRLLVESAPFFERTFVIDHGNAHGAWILRMEDHLRLIIRADNHKDTINYFDTLGNPLSSGAIADAVGMAHVLAGPHDDPDEDHIRVALIAAAIQELYDSAFDEKAKADPSWLRELAKAWLAHKTWGVDQNVGDCDLADTFTDYREWINAHPEEALELCGSIPDHLIDHCLRDPDQAPFLRIYGPAFYETSDFPTHSQLTSLFRVESMGTGRQAERKGTIALLLEPWCHGGPYGGLIDGPTTVTLDHAYVHFELGNIHEEALKRVATYLITNRLIRLVTTLPRSQRKRVIIEECNAFGEFKNGPEMIRHMFERFRKYSTSAICIAQSLQAIDSEPLRKALVANTNQFFLFKQTDRTELERFTESIPLPETTVESILSFPQPSDENGSCFAYVRTGGTYPKVTLCRNIMNTEARQVADQSGEAYEAS